MTSDLPGELGSADPGLKQLLETLASEPTVDELAGEQQALSMFRANIHPPASGPGWLGAAAPGSAPAGPGRAGVRPAGDNGTRPLGALRPPRAPRLRLRLAAVATAVALVSGFAGAAYAAALPAPVQHIVYQAFHFIGVPDSHHNRGAAGHSAGAPTHSATGPGASQPGSSHSSRPASAGPSSSPGTGSSAHPKVSPSPGKSGPGTVGSASLSATASATQIAAGTAVTIDGQLSKAGRPLAGVTVRLWERSAGHLAWHVAGKATSSAQGSVAITVASLTTNARFRLTDPDGRPSRVIKVTVVPGISLLLTQGSAGVKDYLHVITQYARPGDTVVMEGNQNGTWVAIREQTLNARGRTTFVLGARRYKGVELEVVLLATARHAAATSLPLTVPPPA